MKKVLITLVFGFFAVSLMAPSAQAIAPFKKAFQEKYVDKSDSEDFKQAVKKASCNVCHIKGKKKEERNEYGEELAKLIEGNANERIKEAGKNGGAARKAETEKVVEELQKAFEEVAKKESKAGPTYGELIKEGLLPGGEVE